MVATATPLDRPRPAAAPHAGRATRGPVLVCTDGRPAAVGAVRVAAAVAARHGIAPTALAVVEAVVAYVPEVAVALPPEVDADRRAAVVERVRAQLAGELGPAAAAWRVEAECGAPPYAIADAAAACRASLIALGIGRHAAIDRVFGTETALRVLRLAECPVLAVVDHAAALPARAVAAVDFTPASVRAALTAADLLAAGGTLTLVHVKPAVDVSSPVLGAWDATYTRRIDALFARVVEVLADRRPDVRLESVLAAGATADALLDAAAARHADLIAVGSHGAGFMERLMLGSVATSVLRRATCSVLACQQPAPSEAARLQRRVLGTSTSEEAADWAELLEDVSRRNVGRPVTLEVDDPDLGAQVQARGYTLTGVAYDRRDARVDLMLGRPEDGTRHLTRSISGVTAVSVAAGRDGRDGALRVAHGRGQTIATFAD